jgi:N-acetylmuramoyl-L-alanine amidase
LLFFADPAYAGKLLFWRFDSSQNRLTFNTDQGVQPKAQLIANPTRVVIDLPGTILGQPTINQNLGRVITNLRIGQFDSYTTRLVIELAAGYTLDPQQIKIRGISPTQWTVDLPDPQRYNPSSSQYNQSRNSNYNNLPSNSQASQTAQTVSSRTTGKTSLSQGLRVTSSGLLFELDGSSRNQIKTKRSRDGRKIELELHGITLPNNLPRGWTINQYGIKNAEFSQSSSSVAILTLNVEKDSPNWQASFSRMGGLIVWPQGGMNKLASLGYTGSNSTPQVTNESPKAQNVSTPSSTSSATTTNRSFNQKVRIESIEVSGNQLSIRGNGKLQAKGSFNTTSGVYELKLDNVELSPNFRSPTLQANSPISRLRIWQPDSNTVIVLAQPANGVSIKPLNQSNLNTVVVPLTRYRASFSPPPVSSVPTPRNTNTSNNISPLNVTPPPAQSQTWQSQPSALARPSSSSRNPQSKVLVVIDPGHGGKDPGAIGIGGIQEKHIVMSISNQVAKFLEQQGVQVKLTRSNDYFISLQGRTTMANRINADLFVSIHANSAGRNKPHVSGYETYYFKSGRNLAATIHRNVLRRVDVKDRKVRQARFYVLRKSDMPAVLVETGFLTGREDAAKLTNSRYQTQMAEAIAAGIIEYIRTNRL